MQNKNRSESDLKNLLDGIKELLSGYVERKLELYKLKTYEKVAISGSFLGYTLIVVLIVFNISILALITCGLLLGQIVGNMAAGFGMLILVSIVMLLIFIAMKKRFRSYVLNLIVSIIHKIEDNEE